MGLRKAINYHWRLFLPAVLSFWLVIIGMATWQMLRVRQVKRMMVYDQLSIVANRLAYFIEHERFDECGDFIQFVDDFYDRSDNYDLLSVQVRNSQEEMVMQSGKFVPIDFEIAEGEMATGVLRTDQGKSHGDEPTKFLYCTIRTTNGYEVYVMLPYTREVAQVLSASTTRFWLIFFSIAIFITIFVYISTAYYGRNVRILRDFATRAAQSPDFVSPDSYDFPHDEFGDISQQILHIYNQRTAEIERREREHRVAIHAIEEKDRIKREMTGNINHELKTPVGVIQGYIDTIVEDPDMDPTTMRRFLLKTQQNVHRLTSLIADITAITKLESGGRLVNVSDVNFHDLVFTFDNYITEEVLLGGKMTFRYDVPLHCVVLGNESLLTSVLLNFVKNAVAYSGGTMCCLEMTDEDAGFYYFRFYDDGVGVPPEHLPHMFERFYRVNSGRSREAGGTGLGLSIVEVAIKSFGGSIDVSNRYPSGLEFHFSLPKYTKGA